MHHYLSAREIVPAASLSAHLGVSQPTVSRLMQRQRKAIWVFGKARSTRYALRRKIEGVATPVELFEAYGAQGEVRSLGHLYPLGSSFYFECTFNSSYSRIYPALPYFLYDMRPAGFLGRLIPKHHQDLRAPMDIRSWSDADTLRLWTRHGTDLPGNLLLGQDTIQDYAARSVERPAAIDPANVWAAYSAIADDVLRLGLPGSSAAGEQPKFTCITGQTHVLVKFSPASTGAVATRIRDLLIAEHLAHQAIAGAGHNASVSRLIQGSQRLFLEVERFDRLPQGARRGLISLAPLEMEYIGGAENWCDAATGLVQQKLIRPQLLAPIRWLALFGRLIGNTDMHHGNLSFTCDGLDIVDLAPAYDMLPMYAMPRSGELPQQEFSPPKPRPDDAPCWRSACNAAQTFWLDVARHTDISVDFRNAASANHSTLEQLNAMARLLPK